MSRTGTLNPEKIEIWFNIYILKRWLPAVNVATLERLQQQDPAPGKENFICSIDSNPEVGN